MAKSPSSSRKPLPSSPARCTRSSSKSEPASEVGDRTRRPEAERKRREEEKPAQETPASKRPRSGAAEERKTPVKSSGKKQRVETPSVTVKEEEAFDGGSGESCEEEEVSAHEARRKVATKQFVSRKAKNNRQEDAECVFLDDIPRSEAERRWPDRYRKKAKGSPNSEEDDDLLPAVNHYEKANVDGVTYQLDDDVHVKAEEGKDNYIGRIVELFASTDGKQYFAAQWYFRAEDTVIGECNEGHDRKRVFLSEEKNTNLLDCIVSKIVIIRVDMLNKYTLPPCDYYYDMMYSLPYTSFTNLPSESTRSRRSPSSSTVTTDVASETIKEEVSSVTSATLLDLYSGCGAMSTGLCMGAHLSGLKLQTGWAVDINADACSSLQLNHPETKVSNMTADDYLGLLKEWNKLCTKYMFSDNSAGEVDIPLPADEEDSKSNDDSDEEFEVDKFLELCYGDPANCGIVGLKLKVRWKGYGPDEDSWEPIENLGACDEKLQEFVRWGCEQKILPCPGDVDVICGGPPCQGISGFNRFRDRENPLKDVKNKQIVTFFDIVDYLKPKYVLMENVVDLLKFAKGYLGRYAISRLLKMNYQSRLGIMAAGCYGLPQFRGRAFLWGALSHEKLPQFPLPSHHVVVRGVIPTEFEQNLVAYDANQLPKLKDAQRLVDAIADLPKVSNDEDRDVMSYDKPPQTDFQRYIRLSKDAMMGGNKKHCHDKLFDHRPLKLNTDDYQRVQRIPFKKGANFRDLPGLRVREDNVVELDPDVERVYLPSGKPLVPDYAISFIKGKSLKPFGRLWWDEIVPTVVTRAEPHNQVILHPDQARVLTIRENARLQGFPDHYQLRGSIKERYKQVGNAVAVPAARALGYALGKAFMGVSNDDGPVMTLPKDLLSI